MGWKPTPFSFTPLQEVFDEILQDFAGQHLDISMRFVDLYLQLLQSPSRSHQDQLELVVVEEQASQVLQELVPELEAADLQM